jgi:hypothetical protein
MSIVISMCRGKSMRVHGGRLEGDQSDQVFKPREYCHVVVSEGTFDAVLDSVLSRCFADPIISSPPFGSRSTLSVLANFAGPVPTRLAAGRPED